MRPEQYLITATPCQGCGASGPHPYRIRLQVGGGDDGYLLPDTWGGGFVSHITACLACFVAQKALRRPILLTDFQQMQKEKP